MGRVTRQGSTAAKGASMSRGGFLKDWSRRKLEAKRPSPEPEEAVESETVAVPLPDDTEQVDPNLIAALPSLDDITDGFDMTPFLAKGVPASLKNAALRRVWQASPSVRDYADPAVDYAWDWNAPGGVPGGGGILSQASIAKMVKGLVGSRTDPVAKDVHEAINADDPQATPESEATTLSEEPIAPSPPEAVRRSEEAGKADQPEPKERATNAPAAAQPRPRHGGAVPE